MSTVIESLKVKNFEGYKDETFPFSAGLNLIKGRNSTGKSTVLDAVSFALYGEAPDVNPKLLISRLPGCNDIAAYVKFRSPKTEQIIEVEREGKLDAKGGYRKESLHLKINGQEITLENDDDFRARITPLLGASFRQFMNLVYVRQGRLTTILEPKPEQMDSILGITLLRELHAQFDETRSRLEKYEGNDIHTEVNKLEDIIIPQCEQELSAMAKEIPTLQEEADKLQGIIKKAESEECQALLKRIEEKKTMDSRLQNLTTRIQQLFESADAKTIDEIKAKAETYAKQHASLKEEMEKQSRIRDQLHDDWTNVKGRGDALQGENTTQEKLLKKGMTKCPNCGKNVSVSDARTPLQTDETKLNELKNKHTACIKRQGALNEQVKKQTKTKNRQHDEWTRVKGRAEALEEHVIEHEKLLKKGSTRCPTCGQSISASKFKTQLQSDKTELFRLKTQANQANRKYDMAETAVSNLEEKSRNALDIAKGLEQKIDEQEKLLKQGLTKCTCGQTLSGTKLKAQLRTDKIRLAELKTQTKQAKAKYDETVGTLSDLDDKSRTARDKAKTLRESLEKIATYEEEKKPIAHDLERNLNEIRNSLNLLNLQLDPREPTFETALASQIPLSPTELEKKRSEFEKKAQLLKEKTKHEKDVAEKKAKDEVQLHNLKIQLQKASLARQLSEGFDQAIEERRRNQLRNIEVGALRYYNSMTDQHTYSTIHVDPETYKVYVKPKELTDQIPATRTGGGHQTLISLALRLALLHELDFKSLLILDEPTYGVDDQNLPQLATQLAQASKQLTQTIIVTHHGICEEDATNILDVLVGEDGVSRIEPAQR